MHQGVNNLVPQEDFENLRKIGFDPNHTILVAPIYQIAFDFIREEYGIHPSLSPRSWSDEHPIKWSVWFNFLGTTELYDWFGMAIDLMPDRDTDDPFDTFEEARLAALRAMISDITERLEEKNNGTI